MAFKVHPFSHNIDHFAASIPVTLFSVIPLLPPTNLTQGEAMNRRNGSGPKLDLKLNLSPPRVDRRLESPTRSATVSPTSPPSSCVSSELNQEDNPRYSDSPEATSMVLVGCPRCLMYVMLAEDDAKCPKCKSTVLLDFLHDNNNNTNNDNNNNKKTHR
ncbi:protein GL2-INTERACTING REPRESSOR 1-like [Gastrolobium bilobum]|uniref:protein GL2-INTERACTING REPRESSOR 1-like n=1 Tax=Gastrolobium bilobum TaxID=150636 RepID=UPI002AB19A3A|nr:protein GL2-INTERACTING REPRESSOR 1-like [Gastrolobium bilobum]